jgi:hypothetical protein
VLLDDGGVIDTMSNQVLDLKIRSDFLTNLLSEEPPVVVDSLP